MQLKVENSGPRDTAIWIRLNTVFGAGDGQGINAGEGGPPAATPALNPKLLRYSPSLACWSQPPSLPPSLHPVYFICSLPDLPSGPTSPSLSCCPSTAVCFYICSLPFKPKSILPLQSGPFSKTFPSNQSLTFYRSLLFFISAVFLSN